MGDIYGIAQLVLTMVKERGWVVRYESPEAEARGIMKEDARMEMDGKWESPCLCDPCAVKVKLRADELREEREGA